MNKIETFSSGRPPMPNLTADDQSYIERGGQVRRAFIAGRWVKTREPGTAYAQACAKHGEATADQLLRIKERWT